MSGQSRCPVVDGNRERWSNLVHRCGRGLAVNRVEAADRNEQYLMSATLGQQVGVQPVSQVAQMQDAKPTDFNRHQRGAPA